MSSSNSLTPTGDLGAWRVTESPPVDLASVEYIVSNASIAEAWKKVRSNKGAPGVDRSGIEAFPKWGRPKWKLTKKRLLDGTYVPMPALRVEIPKETGGVRRLGIPWIETAWPLSASRGRRQWPPATDRQGGAAGQPGIAGLEQHPAGRSR